MSSRLEISGFDFQSMQKLLGSKNLQAVEALTKKVKNIFSDENMGNITGQIVKQAIMEGVPFKDIEAENDLHVAAAIALADYDQKHLGTKSNFFSVIAFWDSCEGIMNEIDPKAATLLKYFINGRPIFGTEIKSDDSFYAYLLNEELETLKKEITTYIDDDETLEAFCKWIVKIQKANKDLWFFFT